MVFIYIFLVFAFECLANFETFHFILVPVSERAATAAIFPVFALLKFFWRVPFDFSRFFEARVSDGLKLLCGFFKNHVPCLLVERALRGFQNRLSFYSCAALFTLVEHFGRRGAVLEKIRVLRFLGLV